VPSGAVAPASVEEVQAVLKVANKYKLPLWTVSTGKNMVLRLRNAREQRADDPRPEADEPDHRD